MATAQTKTKAPAASKPSAVSKAQDTSSSASSNKVDLVQNDSAVPSGKPAKPDDDQYTKDLAEAEKQHKVAMEQLVSA